MDLREFEDDDVELVDTVTCRNGCPEGWLGRHKFSCSLAGQWLYYGRPALVLGESADGQFLCLYVAGGLPEEQSHLHVSCQSEAGKMPSRVA